MRCKDDRGERIMINDYIVASKEKRYVYIYIDQMYIIVQNVISLSYHDKVVPQFLEYRFLSCVSTIIKYE